MNIEKIDKLEKIQKIIFGVIALFAVLAFVVMSITSKTNFSVDDGNFSEFSKEWTVCDDRDNVTVMDLPFKLDVATDHYYKMEKVLPNKFARCNAMAIRSNKQEIYVYVDNLLRVSYSDKNSQFFNNSNASGYVIMPIYTQDAGKTVTIRAKSAIPQFSGYMETVYIGSERGIIFGLLREQAGILVLCITIIILGVFCYIAGVFVNVTYKRETVLRFLAQFSVIVGCWMFFDLRIRQFFSGDVTTFENIASILLMMLVHPGVMSINYLLKKRFATLYVFLSGASILTFFVECFAMTVGRIDIFYLTDINKAEIFLTSIIVVGTVIYDMIRGYFKELFSLVFGVIALSICVLLEILNSEFDYGVSRGMYAGIGIIIFVIATTVTSMREVFYAEKARKDAINASVAKSRFLATMSHEIRTPINTVLGMNEMILRDSKEKLIKTYATSIAAAGRSLLSLVNDILDFSKIESGKTEIVTVEYNFAVLLSDLVNMSESRMQDKNLKLVTEFDESIPRGLAGDDVRIKQVLTNILTNAIKYTKEGSITFSVKSGIVEENEISILFSVKDTGMGIKKEDQERLLEPFVRVDEQENRSIEGTGLGLSITVKLLQLMGSDLKLESEYGKGSEFFFILKQRISDFKPIGNIETQINGNIKEASEERFTIPDARILVVDDNPMNLTVMKGLLKPVMSQLDTVDSGREAVRMAAEKCYDIIFMDHMMPEMDGIEALHRIRGDKDGKSSRSVIIALTANAVSGAQDIYMREGFNDYITKPVVLSQLHEAILKYLPGDMVKPPSDEWKNELHSEEYELLTTQNIDGNIAIGYCGNDYGSYLETLKTYYRYGRKVLDGTADNKERLFDSKDIKDFTIKAHSLKSSSLTIGARQLSEEAMELESAGNADNISYINENSGRVRVLYETVLDEIEVYLRKKGIIKEVCVPADSAADGNQGVLGAGIREKLQQAKDALDDFEYDDAMEILEEILSGE